MYHIPHECIVDGDRLDLLLLNLGWIDDTIDEEAMCTEDELLLGRLLLLSDVDGKQPSVMAIICKCTSLIPWLFKHIGRANSNDDPSFTGGLITTAATSPIYHTALRLHSLEVLSAIMQHEDYSSNHRGPDLSWWITPLLK